MRKIIVVEIEEDKTHFVAAGLDTLAEIEVSGKNCAVSYTSSIAITKNAYVVYVVGTPSEEDRFFRSWLVDAEYLASRATNASQGSILPAAPSIEAACRNAMWVNRLKQRLNGNQKS